MFFNKYLLPIVSHFYKTRRQNSSMSSQASLINIVTDTVKREISRIILKIVFGLVATGVLIYSLIVLGQHLQFYLLVYENGPFLSVLFFSLLAIGCAFILFKLFHKKETEGDPLSKLFSSDEAKFRIGKIYENFISGLADGIRESNAAEKREQEKIASFEDTDYSDTTH